MPPCCSTSSRGLAPRLRPRRAPRQFAAQRPAQQAQPSGPTSPRTLPARRRNRSWAKIAGRSSCPKPARARSTPPGLARPSRVALAACLRKSRRDTSWSCYFLYCGLFVRSWPRCRAGNGQGTIGKLTDAAPSLSRSRVGDRCRGAARRRHDGERSGPQSQGQRLRARQRRLSMLLSLLRGGAL
jgi:hypothetical protein